MTYPFDPELAGVIPYIPPLDLSDPLAARSALAKIRAQATPRAFPPAIEIGSRTIAVKGQPDVTVRVIRPITSTPSAPAVLWFHGGGFVIGDASMNYPINAHLAETLGAVIVSVEYSLAPEHPYPAALNEGYAALVWMATNAATLGIDRERIAVGGQSAGACLAAAVALLARDEGGPSIIFQALEIPVTDDRLLSPSMQEYLDTPSWTRGNAEDSWRAYLGAVAREDVPAYAAPARAADLTGLPAAFVAVCEFDPLRDEGIHFAQRLTESGVRTEMQLYPGTFHGSSAAVSSAGVSKRMIADFTDALARAFTPLTTPSPDRSLQTAAVA